jgi:hypothetical protein
MGWLGTKHRLVPVEAIAEEEPGSSITLTVDQQIKESAPTFGDPHAAPDEALQRAAREHCGGTSRPLNFLQLRRAEVRRRRI